MTHTRSSKLALANRKHIDVSVFNRRAGSMSNQLKGEEELLIRIGGSIELSPLLIFLTLTLQISMINFLRCQRETDKASHSDDQLAHL